MALAQLPHVSSLLVLKHLKIQVSILLLKLLFKEERLCWRTELGSVTTWTVPASEAAILLSAYE